MTDREKLRVHAQSADHEVVCTSWYNSMVRKGIHWNVIMYVPVHATTLYIPVSEQVSSYHEFPA